MEAAGALAAGAALLLGLYGLLYYYLVAATWCRNAVSLRGKTVLITGGNAGIGKATAVDLARRGARVILACRNKARGESAVYDIRRESGNSEVILMILDLGNLNSVRAFAQTFLESEPRLDILINNADFRTIYKPAEGMWQALRSYSNSQLANIVHVRELAKRLEGTNVTCYAVHPGFVQAEIAHAYPRWVAWLLRTIKPFLRDGKTGAQTIIYCATQEGIERLSGQYFVDCQPKVPWPRARDDLMAEKLWEFNEMLLGLTALDRKGQKRCSG
ncbi:dehydrogenase/reductase SDR family member 13-like isoform X2 [Ahaetulla prasina]|uniref:dehydrogenase/reductase SDR family member 13-like isoform X2 n=1 Tax=Ahaetulla prasina TaxID=499056 RepID=UPI00264A3438|nr:dehydrogenase/reductase SDR family member 13-like isoform X2 [Ahaetulla prasina]